MRSTRRIFERRMRFHQPLDDCCRGAGEENQPVQPDTPTSLGAQTATSLSTCKRRRLPSVVRELDLAVSPPLLNSTSYQTSRRIPAYGLTHCQKTQNQAKARRSRRDGGRRLWRCSDAMTGRKIEPVNRAGFQSGGLP